MDENIEPGEKLLKKDFFSSLGKNKYKTALFIFLILAVLFSFASKTN